MHIPEVKSLTGLLLWIPRFVFNLGFKAHAFLVTALAILPIFLATTERVHTPKGEEIALESSAYLTTGNFEGNADSIRLAKGTEVRLLAKQKGAYWAETADGKFRGFINSKYVGDNKKAKHLAKRERMSCRLISEAKFNRLIERQSLKQVQRKYINAEYIKTRGGKTIVEYGFKVFVPNDNIGTFMRPIVTYDKEGKYLSHKLVFWQSPRSKMMTPGLVDLMAPVASIKEFPRVSPFDKLWMEKMWCYLPGFALLGIFAILLVWRIPLVWMSNSLVALIMGGLAIFPPFVWLSTIKTYGLAGWLSFTYVLLILLNLLFLWVSYSGLRCPQCKHLNQHEFSDKRHGKTYWERHRKAHEESRGPKQNEKWGLWETGRYKKDSGLFDSLSYESRTNDPSQWETVSYRTHSWDQVVTYRDYVTHSQMKEVINSYKCPHCGHGKEDIEKVCVDKKEEWSNTTYTKHLYYTEKVASDGRIFDHECKER